MSSQEPGAILSLSLILMMMAMIIEDAYGEAPPPRDPFRQAFPKRNHDSFDIFGHFWVEKVSYIEVKSSKYPLRNS